MGLVRKSAKGSRTKTMASRNIFLAKPYQTPGNGSKQGISYSLSQEIIVTTGNMQNPIGSAVAERPKKMRVT